MDKDDLRERPDASQDGSLGAGAPRGTILRGGIAWDIELAKVPGRCGRPAPSAAELGALLGQAEDLLAGIAGDARWKSRAAVLVPASWSVMEGRAAGGALEMSFELGPRGWFLENVAGVGSSRLVDESAPRESQERPLAASLIRAQSRAGAMLNAAGSEAKDVPSKEFFGWIERGLFGVDQPLAGAWGAPSLSEPISALSHCAIYASALWIERLLAMGADPNARGPQGLRPLHFAIQSLDREGSLRCVELLLAAGADPLAVDDAGRGPAEGIEEAGLAQFAAGRFLAEAARAGKEARELGPAAAPPEEPGMDSERRFRL